MSKAKAFTLLEVLLSVAIGVVVLITLYSSFYLGTKVWARVSGNTDKDARKIISQLAHDLRCSYILEQEDSDLRFTGKPTSLKFVTTAPLGHILSVKHYDLREVDYFLA